MLLLEIVRQLLVERMSFTDLFKSSTPARKDRAKGMKSQSLPVMASRGPKHWNFRFTSAPNNNTTGKSWKGRIGFPKSTGVARPDRLMCEVDCECPDYKYRWAWANNRKDAGPIGFGSFNKCIDQAPRETNPTNRPGLCKHLLALKDGLRQRLKESQQPTLESKLDEIVTKYPQFDVTYDE
jgi:hypothetical protein